MKKEMLDLSNEKNEKEKVVRVTLWHPDKARMKLAYIVLTGIFFIFLLSIFCDHLAIIHFLDLNVSNALFELCKTGLLPIVTLILGYYFSKNNEG